VLPDESSIVPTTLVQINERPVQRLSPIQEDIPKRDNAERAVPNSPLLQGEDLRDEVVGGERALEVIDKQTEDSIQDVSIPLPEVDVEINQEGARWEV
jgi:hypothetical protein